MFFCDLKGVDKKSMMDDFILSVVIYLVLMGITYWLVSVQSIKKNKPNYSLYGALVYALLIILALASGDNSSNNFYDWMSYVIGGIQVILMMYVYNEMKPKNGNQ
jgi:uncharacterized membrane protein YwzB